MMRNDNGGVSTRDIMDATGCSEQRVRAAVTEIRQRVGESAVVTHTQQSNGASYGDGTDHTRYEVLTAFQTTDGAFNCATKANVASRQYGLKHPTIYLNGGKNE